MPVPQPAKFPRLSSKRRPRAFRSAIVCAHVDPAPLGDKIQRLAMVRPDFVRALEQVVDNLLGSIEAAAAPREPGAARGRLPKGTGVMPSTHTNGTATHGASPMCSDSASVSASRGRTIA
jgi:hypothetical protein